MTDPVFCFHPDMITEYHHRPAGWVKRRKGRRWRQSWRRQLGVHVKRCPACPATAMHIDVGMPVLIALPPWLVDPLLIEQGKR